YSGTQAIGLIQQEAGTIHLAILDIMVPGVDGKEICRHIRNHPVLNDIPVIFLTAKDQEKDEIEGLELGADDYIAKPASLNLVQTHVETLLRRRNPQNTQWLQYGSAYLDLNGKELYVKNKEINLTSTEYHL